MKGSEMGDNNSFRILLCVLNTKYIHSSLAPWCLSAAVQEYCGSDISVSVSEFTINNSADDILSFLLDKSPDVLGFSCYIWNISMIKILAEAYKKARPDSYIVVGGPEVSYNISETLTLPGIDYVISGEGERPFSKLADLLSHSLKPTGPMPGISFTVGLLQVISEPYFSDEEYPSPYTEDYINSLKGRISYIETSRGCPFSCAFCLSGAVRGLKYFSLDRIKKELVLIANNSKTVKFVDRTFNSSSARSREIWKYIIESSGSLFPKETKFHFEIAGDLLSAEDADLLSAAPDGLFQFEIGFQSFNEASLSAINRVTDMTVLIKNTSALLSRGNIHTHIDLIAGLPHEDYGSFIRSFNSAYSLRPHMLQLGFLKLLHGADMREKPGLYPCEYSSAPPYEVISTPYISPKELSMIKSAEDASDALYNSGRFRKTLEYVIPASGTGAFEFFLSFSQIKKAEGTPLDQYTEEFYRFCCGLPGIDPERLRDLLAADRISSVYSAKIPLFLQRGDPRLGKIKAFLKSKKIRGTPVVLYTENRAVYADYSIKDPVTGEYKLTDVSI